MTAEMEGVNVQRDDVEARQTRSVSEDAMVDVEGAMGMGAAGGREEGRNGAGVSSNDNAVGWLDEMVNMCVGRASIPPIGGERVTQEAATMRANDKRDRRARTHGGRQCSAPAGAAPWHRPTLGTRTGLAQAYRVTAAYILPQRQQHQAQPQLRSRPPQS